MSIQVEVGHIDGATNGRVTHTDCGGVIVSECVGIRRDELIATPDGLDLRVGEEGLFEHDLWLCERCG